MKVTFVCDFDAYGRNGAGIATMNLIRAMKDRGHEVTAVYFGEDKDNSDGSIVLSRNGLRMTAVPGKDGESLERSVNGSLELIIADSDAVYIPGYTAAGRIALGFALRHKIPVAAGFCAGATGSPSRALAGNVRLANLTVYRMMYNRFYQYADAVLFPTECCRRMLEKAAGCEIGGIVAQNAENERPSSGMFSDSDSVDIFEDMLHSIR